MKKGLWLIAIITSIIIMMSACGVSNLSNEIRVDVRVNSNIDSGHTNMAPEAQQNDVAAPSNSTAQDVVNTRPAWFYPLIIIIVLPLFLVGIWFAYIIIKVYRNRNRQP